MELRFERNDDPRLVQRLDPGRMYVPAPGELERRAAIDPEGNLLARAEDGSVAGVVSVVVWGRLAWLYGMMVAADKRRRGVGRAMLRHAVAHARARGADAIGLDATEEGRALYEAEGFVAVGETPRWRLDANATPRAPEGERRVSVYPISACEIMDLWKYDLPRFGANRVPWLASCMQRFPERTFVAFDRASGDIAGFVTSHERWIGPLVADTRDAAEWLLFAALRAGAPRAIIPQNPSGAALAEAAGFAPDGHACTRMALGALPGRRETQWLVSGWALG